MEEFKKLSNGKSKHQLLEPEFNQLVTKKETKLREKSERTFNCFFSEFITPEWLKNMIEKEEREYEELDDIKRSYKLNMNVRESYDNLMSYLTEKIGKKAYIMPVLIPFIEQISTSMNESSEDCQLLVAYIIMNFFCTNEESDISKSLGIKNDTEDNFLKSMTSLNSSVYGFINGNITGDELDDLNETKKKFTKYLKILKKSKLKLKRR